MSLIKSLETELANGSKNEISLNILNMFSEFKQAQAEHKFDDDGNLHAVLPSAVEKQFIMRLDGKMVHKGTGGPQFLR